MNIINKEDALQYKEAYVKFIAASLEQHPRTDNLTAEDIANENLGYYAGYFSNEVRQRVETLFLCVHPLFGSIVEKGPPSTSDALKIGLELGENHS